MSDEEQLTPTAAAGDFEQYKAIREGKTVEADAQPVEEVAVPEDSEPAETPASETEPDSETGETQEPKKRDRGAEKRISDLTAKFKAAEQERDELRKKVESYQVPTPVQAPTQPAAAVDTSDPEPKETDEAFQGENGYSKYLRAASKWDLRQEQAQQREKERVSAAQASIQSKEQAARVQYPDYDLVIGSFLPQRGGTPPTAAMIQFLNESDAGAKVLYAVGKDPAERARIAALSPVRQMIELAKIEDRLTAPPPPVPETPKPQPVSRAAPPPKPIGGTEAVAPKALSDAANQREYRRMREKQRR